MWFLLLNEVTVSKGGIFHSSKYRFKMLLNTMFIRNFNFKAEHKINIKTTCHIKKSYIGYQ